MTDETPPAAGDMPVQLQWVETGSMSIRDWEAFKAAAARDGWTMDLDRVAFIKPLVREEPPAE